MARPTEYDGTRVDTKVRLRADHARLLKDASEERGLGRNRLVEMALDAFFGLTAVGPRLAKMPTDPDLSQGTPKTPPRARPRLQSSGSAMEAQSARRTPRRAP